MRRRTRPGRLQSAIANYRDARAHRRWAESVGHATPSRRRGLVVALAIVAAAILAAMALQPSWSPFPNENAGGSERRAGESAEGLALGKPRRGGVLGALARFDPESGRVVDARPEAEWIAAVPDTATWVARDLRAAELAAWELDTDTYRRLTRAAKELRGAIAELRRGGVTAAERVRLRRLQMELALVQRALLRHRVAVIARGGVTAAEAAELRRLRAALLRVERRLVRWRIDALTAGGVTPDEATRLAALQAELRRLSEAMAAGREWLVTPVEAPPTETAPTTTSTAEPPPAPEGPPAQTPRVAPPQPPVEPHRAPQPAPAAPATDEAENADEPDDVEAEEAEEADEAEEPEIVEKPEKEKAPPPRRTRRRTGRG